MIIEKERSDKIVTISTSIKENRGGIASVVNVLSGYYESFNYIASTRSKNALIMTVYFIKSVFQLFYYILVKRIKVAHIHGSSYGSFLRKMILINICRFFHVKIVYHIHSGGFKRFYEKYNRKNIIKKTLNKSDALIVLSQSWKEFFSTIEDENKIFILNNTINNPHFNRNYRRDSSVIHFLFLGKVGKGKGIFDLLEIIKDNKDSLNDKFFLHVGGNGETNKLIEYVEKQQLQKLVKFEGWVSGEKKIELLTTCDVFILPSYYEGLPISILEAMSYGMPIISTPVGGIPEIITDKENGLLITPGNKDEILRSIKHFIDFPQEIENMGMANHQRIADFYPENVISQLSTIYNYLLS
jgi:glycosyltransferase involved in cell wall biosynthesis